MGEMQVDLMQIPHIRQAIHDESGQAFLKRQLLEIEDIVAGRLSWRII